MLGHGTTVPAGVSVCTDRFMIESVKGKVGSGLYGFDVGKVKGLVDIVECMKVAWKRCIFYNRGHCSALAYAFACEYRK